MNFRGERRSNATHRSVTDPDAGLTRKSHNTAALLGYVGTVLMDNRHGLVVATDVRAPSYEAERDAALALAGRLEPRARRRTVRADKGYDTDGFVAALRRGHVRPHISPNLHASRRHSAIDRRTTRHAGYEVSQRTRKRVGEIFGWDKVIKPRAEAPASRAGDRGLGVHLHQCRLQSGAPAHSDRGRGGRLTHPTCPPSTRWAAARP